MHLYLVHVFMLAVATAGSAVMESWSDETIRIHEAIERCVAKEDPARCHREHLSESDRRVHDRLVEAFDLEADPAELAESTRRLVEEAGFDGERAAALVRAALEQEDADADD